MVVAAVYCPVGKPDADEGVKLTLTFTFVDPAPNSTAASPLLTVCPSKVIVAVEVLSSKVAPLGADVRRGDPTLINAPPFVVTSRAPPEPRKSPLVPIANNEPGVDDPIEHVDNTSPVNSTSPLVVDCCAKDCPGVNKINNDAFIIR